MKLSIIGSGNAANVLGRKIVEAGHSILQVTGRNQVAVQELAMLLEASPNTDPQSIDRSADLYVVALADAALPPLHQWLQLDRKTVVHTAAAVSKDVLQGVSRNYGVLYPLQTLRKEQTQLPEIPFLVDGNTADDLALIEDFAQSLSSRVMVADDATRLRVHIAAVFANNFTNHLYSLTHDFCNRESLDFSLLLPLIDETAKRLHTLSPKSSQTGPAVRNDSITLQKHLQVLQDHPHLKEIYERLTASIQEERP